MSEQLIPPPLAPQRPPPAGQQIGWRVLFVSLLALIMLLPLLAVRNVVTERNTHYNHALTEVANAWGRRQTLVGPVLIIPYVEHFTNVDTVTEPNGESRVVSKDIFNERTAILLPEQLEIRADLQAEHQRQGIYDALVYTAKLSINGTFDHSPMLQAAENDRRIAWDKAYIAIGLDDTRAIDSTSSLFWNEGRIDLQPGTRLGKLLPHGFHVPLMVTADSNTSNEFKLTLSLRGSDGLLFAPVGENTAIRISSPWTMPRFIGELLPDKQTLNEQGFRAEWDIPHLVRNYPQSWVLEETEPYDLHHFTIGVSLAEPQSLYAQVAHSVQYGILFIGLTFLALLAFETRQQRHLHVLHYVVVGAVLLSFYLILLALAEHLGFQAAYLAAALTTILLVSAYTQMILRKFQYSLLIALLLAALYSLLYFLLQWQDYDLIAGAALLLLLTGILMLITRHVKTA